MKPVRHISGLAHAAANAEKQEKRRAAQVANWRKRRFKKK